MSDYVCPQCGPDPAGPVSHQQRYHMWPVCSCPDAIEHDKCSMPGCVCEVHGDDE